MKFETYSMEPCDQHRGEMRSLVCGGCYEAREAKWLRLVALYDEAMRCRGGVGLFPIAAKIAAIRADLGITEKSLEAALARALHGDP